MPDIAPEVVLIGVREVVCRVFDLRTPTAVAARLLDRA
jgi:hypothetical protein